MANQNSDLESNVNKRVKMNITMNIELKNSESGKEYHKIVEAVTKHAMTCIDAALAPTNSISNRTPADTKEIAKLRPSLDNKNSKNIRKLKGNATSSNTTSAVSSGTKKADTSRKEEETDKRVETEAMKKVRQSLELKNLMNLKKNKNDNPVTISSRCGIVAGTNNANYSKEATHTVPKAGKEKPSVETEAMKRIRLSLELKNKTKENNPTPSTSSSPNRSSQRVEGTGNTKSLGRGIKRKVADGTDKTQTETERVKRAKVNNSGRNENNSRTANTTSGITYQQMDISDDTDDENVSASSVTGTGSTNITRENKRVTEKVETEAMKLIRRRLELNKTKNKNEVRSYGTIAPSSTISSATRVVKEKETVKSPKAVMRNSAVNNPTEEMKIMKERIEQRKKPQRNETRNTKPTRTYAKTGHEIDLKCNPTPSYTFEITEDESDDNSAVYTNKNSETTNADNNKPNKRKRSTPSYLSTMSADVEQPDNTAATTIRRMTRSKSSKTWERKAWTK